MYIMIKNLIKSFVERFMNRGMDTDTDKRQGLIYCYFNFPSINPFCYKILKIVPFVATPLKGQFIVFLKWLLIGNFRLD